MFDKIILNNDIIKIVKWIIEWQDKATETTDATSYTEWIVDKEQREQRIKWLNLRGVDYKIIDVEIPNSITAFNDERFIYGYDEAVQYINSIGKYEPTTILRTRRENECFSIINRGQLWYDSLNAEQITELKEWYQKWLNVTDTNVIPNKPQWIK